MADGSGQKKPSVALIVGSGLGLATALGLALAYRNRQQLSNVAHQGADQIQDWVETLFRKTSEHEGTYWSVQRNLDGQGVSYGFIQWTQIAGGLAKVLDRMRAADPALFDTTFGGTEASAHMMAAVHARSMAPVDGANLWDEPWLSRFRAAGHLPVFQAAQRAEAGASEYMKAAKEIAGLLGVKTERAMTMYYNRAVHQGAEGALGPARALAAWYAADPSRRPGNPKDVLAQYAWRAAAKFRKVGKPAKLEYNSRGLLWKPVTTEYGELRTGDYAASKVKGPAPADTYHVFAAGFPVSLYDLITMRSGGILTDPSLRDVDVAFDAPAVGAVPIKTLAPAPNAGADTGMKNWIAAMRNPKENLPVEPPYWSPNNQIRAAVIGLDESEIGGDSNAAARRCLDVAKRLAPAGIEVGCIQLYYGLYVMWFAPAKPTEAELLLVAKAANY